MSEQEKPWTLLQRIGNVFSFGWSTVQEIYLGIKNDRVPAHIWCTPGMATAFFMIFHWDQAILKSVTAWIVSLFGPSPIGHIHLVPALHLSEYAEYKIRRGIIYFLLFSGWIIWGVYRSIQKNSFLDRLTEALEAARLRCNGRYPSFIEDAEIDEHTRRLRLRTHGVTRSEFATATEKLETMMNVTIVRMLQEEDKGRVDIVYTTQDLPKVAHLENPERFTRAQVPIGICHEGDFVADLRAIGHILISGQTGGGKSNSLKVMASVISRNNPDAQIYFMDFKGGMESADLRHQIGNINDNIVYLEGTKACIEKLKALGVELVTRLKTLTDAQASSLDDYIQAKSSPDKAEGTTDNDAGRFDREKLRRTFIMIDEAAQLYVKEPGIDRELLEEARAAVNRVARQGRAAGVHLIIATQKPDSQSFDQTVKANLPAVLCFPMATQAASISAVGSKRAYELNPDIKGRAIWKFGPKVEEVQTYLFS
jgi:energy-coupling factor transporter ATP-binding protein EcfA2